MNNLNPFAISGLLIVIAYLPLFLLILIKGKTRLTKIFSLHILSVFIWGLSAFFVGINTNATLATLIWKFACSAVLFIPVFFLHAVFIMMSKRARLILSFAYAQAVFFLYIILTDQMFPVVKLVFNSFYYLLGNTYYLAFFLIWVFLTSFAHIQLILFYRKSFPEQKKQIICLLWAIIGFVGGVMNFMPGFGKEIYPYGNFLIPMHSVLVSYAILKHQLLELQVVIRRGLVYSILIALISLIYLTIVVFLERMLEYFFGYRSILISISSAFALGIIFVPLRNKIQRLVDQMCFHGTQEEFAQRIELLNKEVAKADKLKATATLASGIAHEIKNPLTAVKTFTEYLPHK